MKYIAVMGYGIVGEGVVRLIDENSSRLMKAVDDKVCVKRILDIRKFPGNPYNDLITDNFDDILNDGDICTVAETIGGTRFAYGYTKRLLENGKSVVTSNKELVALHGEELMSIAAEKGVHYFFEAAVGGGIPIIKSLVSCLEANNYVEIKGILNGTTNYILTKMENDKLSFEAALKDAQELGYAEKNPSADVDGHDTCRKICILASIAYGKTVLPEDVYTEGISKLTAETIASAADKGYKIKLIGYAAKKENGTAVFVSPCAIPKTNRLASVDDVYNAVTVSCDVADDMTFIGKGAGRMPTASAVVSDIIDSIMLSPAKKSLWETDRDPILKLNNLNLSYLEGTELPILE